MRGKMGRDRWAVGEGIRLLALIVAGFAELGLMHAGAAQLITSGADPASIPLACHQL